MLPNQGGRRVSNSATSPGAEDNVVVGDDQTTARVTG
jgi:hypothetical protein